MNEDGMEINAPDASAGPPPVAAGLASGTYGNFADAILAGLPSTEQIANTLGIAALGRLADRIGNKPASAAVGPAGTSTAKLGRIADVGVQFDLSPNMKLLLGALAVVALGLLIYKSTRG